MGSWSSGGLTLEAIRDVCISHEEASKTNNSLLFRQLASDGVGRGHPPNEEAHPLILVRSLRF